MSVDLAMEIESLKQSLAAVNEAQGDMEERLDANDEKVEELDETDEKLQDQIEFNKAKIEEV